MEISVFSLTFFVATFVSAFAGYLFLLKLRNFSRNNIWRKMLYVPVGKSLSNSQSLGGFVFLNVTLLAYSSRIFLDYESFSGEQVQAFASFVLAAAIILGYGYLDDCHEVKARYKLLAQFFISCIMSASAYSLFPADFTFLTLPITFILSMASLNGANLMDGADTISVKVGSSIFAYYFFLGSYFELSEVSEFAIFSAAPLMAFYFFNKFPSKIHLGEIGGAFLGLLYISMAITSCRYLAEIENVYNAVAYSTFPLLFPVGELGITFCRRLFFRKRVFSGDHFHLHHLLMNHMKLSVVATSNIMGGVAASTLVIQAIAIFHLPNVSMVSYITLGAGLAITYIALGYSVWKQASKATEDKSLSDMFNVKKIELLSAKVIDDFEFSVKEVSKDNSSEKTDKDKKAS